MTSSGAIIVLVHGLWNRGWFMWLMQKRLKKRGHRVAVFSYATRGDHLEGHADQLKKFIDGLEADRAHLVGHSMGGLVILNMLSRHRDVPPGRVVLMGTPVNGSAVVKRLQKLPGQQVLFGKALDDLLKGFQKSPEGRDTGMVRGTRAFGLGQVTGAHGEPSDGTVRVSETELDGLEDSVELPVTHTQMLLSTGVVEQVEHFLLHGKFKDLD